MLRCLWSVGQVPRLQMCRPFGTCYGALLWTVGQVPRLQMCRPFGTKMQQG